MSGVLIVRDIMVKNVKTVRTDEKVIDVVKKMNKFRIGSVIVTNNGRPVGIVTERDILQRLVEIGLNSHFLMAKDIMTAPIVTINSHESIKEAAKIMTHNQIKKLPVVERGKLMGIVSTSDIVKNCPTQIDIMDELLKIRYNP